MGVLNHHECRDFLILGSKLLRHLERDGPTQAPASKEIWTMRLNGPNLLDVMRRHIFNPPVHDLRPVETLGLQTVKRSVLTETTCQCPVEKNVTCFGVDEEDWRFDAPGLNLDE